MFPFLSVTKDFGHHDKGAHPQTLLGYCDNPPTNLQDETVTRKHWKPIVDSPNTIPQVSTDMVGKSLIYEFPLPCDVKVHITDFMFDRVFQSDWNMVPESFILGSN